MKDNYRLTVMPVLPTEQFPEHLVTFVAFDRNARRMWTVYRRDLTKLFDRFVSRTEAEKIVCALREGLTIEFDRTFTTRQMLPLGFLQLD